MKRAWVMREVRKTQNPARQKPKTQNPNPPADLGLLDLHVERPLAVCAPLARLLVVEVGALDTPNSLQQNATALDTPNLLTRSDAAAPDAHAAGDAQPARWHALANDARCAGGAASYAGSGCSC